MKEQWRDILDFEGFYQVSNLGNVRSLDREIIDRRGHHKKYQGQILNQTPDSDGYLVVTLSKKGKSRLIKVHRLVLETFRGPCPPGLISRHKNGRCTDNVPSNLVWGSQLENQRDRKRHGRGPQGDGNGRVKITDKTAAKIAAAYSGKYGELVRYAKHHNVSTSTIRRIVRGIRRMRHHGSTS